MTAAGAWARHSIPNLLGNFSASTTPVQLVPHRGISEYIKAIPDGSKEVLWRTSIGTGGEGGNAIAFDPVWIAGKPCIMHDFTGNRLWPPPPGQSGVPKLIPKGGDGFPESYIFPAAPLLHYMRGLLSLNPAVTIFLDASNQSSDASRLVALLSDHPAYHHCVVVQLYPYAFRNGTEFVDEVNDLGPTDGWKRMVSIVPVLNPDALPVLARVQHNSLDYTILYNAGQAWVSSMIATNMKIFGLGFPVSGIGRHIDPTTGETHDLNGNLVTKPKVKAAFLWDRVLLDLVTWAKETYPNLAIIMYSMTCSYTYGGGQRYTTGFPATPPVRWPEGAESHGRELMAVPGNALQHGANIVICDRATDNLNAVLGTKIYSWPKDVDYPIAVDPT